MTKTAYDLEVARCALSDAHAHLAKAADVVEATDPGFAADLRRAAARAADRATPDVLARQTHTVLTTAEKQAQLDHLHAAAIARHRANGGRNGR